MIKCKFCGAEIPDGTRFCSFCGGKTKVTSKITLTPNNFQKKRNPLRAGILAWSIVNIVLGIFGIITIFPFSASVLGVISVIYIILAQDSQDSKCEKTKIRIAVILNIIASAILIISFILLIVFLFMELYMPVSVPNNSLNIEDFMEMYPYLD